MNKVFPSNTIRDLVIFVVYCIFLPNRSINSTYILYGFQLNDISIYFYAPCSSFKLLIKKDYRNIFLLLVSLLFYAWGEVLLVLLMLFSISINYISGIGIGIALFLERKRKILQILLGIATALYFCYLKKKS